MGRLGLLQYCFIFVRQSSQWKHRLLLREVLMVACSPTHAPTFTLTTRSSFSFCYHILLCCKVPHEQCSVFRMSGTIFPIASFCFPQRSAEQPKQWGWAIIHSFVQMKTMSKVLSLLDVNGSQTRSPTKIWGRATLMAKKLKRWARSCLESRPIPLCWRTSQTVAAY